MAIATSELIGALRATAMRLKKGSKYQWGHMGSCNCGHLAQTITKLTRTQIHEYAMRRSGDWSDQADDFCPESGLPFDLLISELLSVGLELQDLKHLEKLSSEKILRRIQPPRRLLRYNFKDDVIIYMLTWADLLEEELSTRINQKTFAKESIMELSEIGY